MSLFPNSNDRAAWAAAAVEVFGDRTGQRDPEYLIDPEAVAEIVGDLICDLLHFVEAAGGSPNTVLFNGLGHFEQEAAEDAAEQLEARSRFLGFTHLGGDEWDLMVLDTVTEACEEFARLTAGRGGQTVMGLYRIVGADPDTGDTDDIGDSFSTMEYRLTATPSGVGIERI
jgi:hypothetical protein